LNLGNRHGHGLTRPFSQALLDDRLQRQGSDVLVLALDFQAHHAAGFHPQRENRDQAFGVRLFGAMPDADSRLEGLGRIDQDFGRPGVQAGRIVHHDFKCLHLKAAFL